MLFKRRNGGEDTGAGTEKHGGKEKGPEKAVYTSESSHGVAMALVGLLYLVPQLLRVSGGWAVAAAVVIGLPVALGGVMSVITSTNKYRLGLDDRLIGLAGVGRNCRALNAACGTGSLAVSLGKVIRTGEVVATDRWKPTKRTLDPSKRLRDNIRIEGVADTVRVQEADPLALPFKAGYFNMVGTRHGVSGMRKGRRDAFMEMLRVTRTGGYVVFSESPLIALWLRYRVLPRLMSEYKVGDVRLSRFHLSTIVSAQKLG